MATPADINRAGLFSARPAASAALAGILYFATDSGALYRCNGSGWDLILAAGGLPEGGSEGDVLAIVDGDPAWAAPAEPGMANPMTQDGDLLYYHGQAAENVALASKGASATSYSHYGSQVAGLAIDGNEATYWCTGSSNPIGASEYLEVDLGQPRTIHHWRVYQDPGNGWPTNVILSSSDNGTDWTQRDSMTGTQNLDHDQDLPADITARYWKLTPDGSNGIYGWTVRTLELVCTESISVDRLPIGSAGQVLSVVDGKPAWVTPG